MTAVTRLTHHKNTLATAILPVDRYRGPASLIQALKDTNPDAVLCLGQAGRSPALTIERVAVNLLDSRLCRNGRCCPQWLWQQCVRG